MTARSLALSVLVLGAAACTDFPVIPANECGNAVLEEGEDCDTFVKDETRKCRPKGVEGACHYDCTEGGDGQRFQCPGGMGCASDGLCRVPTGDFEPKSRFTEEASSSLSAVDFDNDGHLEVISTEPTDQLTQARFRLHYFDADAKLVETRIFPRFTTRPIASDVTAGPEQDLIFSNGRIGVVPGRADHEWVPATFSSYVVPDSGLRIAGVRNDAVSGALPVAALTTIDGVSGIYVPNFPSGFLELRARLPGSVQGFAGEVLTSNVFDAVDSPCSELVVAYRGEHRLHVFDMCELNRDPMRPDVVWRDVPLEQVVELPAQLAFDAGPLSGDVDGDGHLDVMVSSAGLPYVVSGTGSELLESAVPLELEFIGNQMTPKLVMPLAMGDFTGDGVADYVLPQSVLSSREKVDGTGIGHFVSFENRREPWTLAQIADLNGNGFPDVVGATHGAAGLSFLNGTGGPYQVPARIATQRPVSFLDAGDFDGDLIRDLAIVESGSEVERKDSLSIAYGARDSLPLPATRVAEIEGVEQLGDCNVTNMDTIFVTTSSAQQSTFTLFDGSPDRLPFATYTLVTFAQNAAIRDTGAVGLALGAFSQPGARDIVAVGNDLRSQDWTLWLLHDFGGQSQPPRALEFEQPEGASPVSRQGEQYGVTVAGASADLDHDELDEALWLMPEGNAGCALLVYDIDAASDRALPAAQLHFDTACPKPQLASVDLDRDGSLDVLALLGDPAADTGRLELLWNDGSGGLSLDGGGASVDALGHGVRGFSAFHDKPEIAFVTEGGLYRAIIDTGARAIADVVQLERLRGGSSVVVTDPNGDELSDIVVADDQGLFLLRAQLR